MDAWAFIIGMVAGAIVTVFVLSLCAVASSADRHIEANIEKHWRAKEKEKRHASVPKEG